MEQVADYYQIQAERELATKKLQRNNNKNCEQIKRNSLFFNCKLCMSMNQFLTTWMYRLRSHTQDTGH